MWHSQRNSLLARINSAGAAEGAIILNVGLIGQGKVPNFGLKITLRGDGSTSPGAWYARCRRGGCGKPRRVRCPGTAGTRADGWRPRDSTSCACRPRTRSPSGRIVRLD